MCVALFNTSEIRILEGRRRGEGEGGERTRIGSAV